jgi:hypothetical protein
MIHELDTNLTTQIVTPTSLPRSLILGVKFEFGSGVMNCLYGSWCEKECEKFAPAQAAGGQHEQVPKQMQ